MQVAIKKRVLLVNDGASVRSALSRALAKDQDLEVSGTAGNGRSALANFSAVKPDIVLLDFEMPETDGLATVRELRKKDPHVPIIMFSNLTEHGAVITLEALSLGVTDYVTKPSNGDIMATLDAISGELIPKVRALCQLPEVQNKLAPAPTRKRRPHPRSLALCLDFRPRYKLWPLASPLEDRTLWPGFCLFCRQTCPCRSSSCSTCREFLHPCWHRVSRRSRRCPSASACPASP